MRINDIKTNYKKLCLQRHPDKGGSVREFQKLQNAKQQNFKMSNFQNQPKTITPRLACHGPRCVPWAIHQACGHHHLLLQRHLVVQHHLVLLGTQLGLNWSPIGFQVSSNWIPIETQFGPNWAQLGPDQGQRLSKGSPRATQGPPRASKKGPQIVVSLASLDFNWKYGFACVLRTLGNADN